MPEESHQILDATGLSARETVLRTRRALEILPPGAILLVNTDARDTIQDIPAYCSQAGHSLLFAEDRDGLLSFYIEKK